TISSTGPAEASPTTHATTRTNAMIKLRQRRIAFPPPGSQSTSSPPNDRPVSDPGDGMRHVWGFQRREFLGRQAQRKRGHRVLEVPFSRRADDRRGDPGLLE